MRLPEKTTSHVVLKNVDRLSPAYMELSRAYRRGDVDEVRKIFEIQAEGFLRDKNIGLIRQAISALNRANIQRLTKTYVTLSITDLALQSGVGTPQVAEQAVLSMVTFNPLIPCHVSHVF
jgi:COP9 signalosome complex subunit 3